MSRAAWCWQGHGQPDTAAAGNWPARGDRGRPRPRLLVWLAAGLAAAAAVVVTALAASYQPLSPGGSGGGSFPGLHTGTGLPRSRRMPARSSASIGRLRTGSAGAGVSPTGLIRAAARAPVIVVP